MDADPVIDALGYPKTHKLLLTTAESCIALATTGAAGRIQRFFGERADVMRKGAHYELSRLALYRRGWLRGESA